MPEGDTLQQARLQIRPILEGQRLESLWVRKLRGHRPRSGQLIQTVRVHGKNLLVDFDPKLTLRVHLGMAGYWRTTGPSGSDHLRSNPYLRLELATKLGVARCFKAPGIETFVRDAELTPLTNLGPDLVVSPEDLAETVMMASRRARARCADDDLIADVLLNQKVAAGIGNVYKSEVLFLAGVHPLTPFAQVSDVEVANLYQKAGTLLRIHSQPGNAFRVTTAARPSLSGQPSPYGQRRPAVGSARHYVYERWRAPCLRCQTPIRRSYAGRLGRSTYWCPTCQTSRVHG